MLILFAIVAVLMFQLGQCLLFFYLMDEKRYRRLVNEGFSSVF